MIGKFYNRPGSARVYFVPERESHAAFRKCMHVYITYMYGCVCMYTYNFQNTKNQQEEVSLFFISDILVTFLITTTVKQRLWHLTILMTTIANKTVMLISSTSPIMQNELNNRKNSFNVW